MMLKEMKENWNAKQSVKLSLHDYLIAECSNRQFDIRPLPIIYRELTELNHGQLWRGLIFFDLCGHTM